MKRVKRCSKCKEAREASEFGRDNRKSDGLQSHCRPCQRAANRHRYQEDPEKYKAMVKRHRDADPAAFLASRREYWAKNREHLNQKQRDRYSDNPEAWNERSRAYYAANTEKVNASCKAWKQRNRDKAKSYAARYRGRKLSATKDVEALDVWQMYEDQDGLCAYCETPLFGEFHVEHMTPLVRGGLHDWTNLAVTCARCNHRKHTKTVEEYMQCILGSPTSSATSAAASTP